MIKYNERGEVISVNGLVTGHHIGTPMQDAIAERPEDNENYATQRNTKKHSVDMIEDNQPKPVGGGTGGHWVFIGKDENGDNLLTASDGIFDALTDFFTKGKVVHIAVYDYDPSGHTIFKYAVNQVVDDNSGEQIHLYCDDGLCLFIHKDGNLSYYWD